MSDAPIDGPAKIVAPTPCYTCAGGHMHPTSLRDRVFHYRGAVLDFDGDVVVPVCDTCGDLHLGGERTSRVDAVLTRLHLAVALRLADPDTRHPETDWGPPVGKEIW